MNIDPFLLFVVCMRNGIHIIKTNRANIRIALNNLQ